jgi:hypothetical protein
MRDIVSELLGLSRHYIGAKISDLSPEQYK